MMIHVERKMKTIKTRNKFLSTLLIALSLSFSGQVFAQDYDSASVAGPLLPSLAGTGITQQLVPVTGPVYTTVSRCGGGNALCPSGWSEVSGSRFTAPAGLSNCGYQNYVTCQRV